MNATENTILHLKKRVFTVHCVLNITFSDCLWLPVLCAEYFILYFFTSFTCLTEKEHGIYRLWIKIKKIMKYMLCAHFWNAAPALRECKKPSKRMRTNQSCPSWFVTDNNKSKARVTSQLRACEIGRDFDIPRVRQSQQVLLLSFRSHVLWSHLRAVVLLILVITVDVSLHIHLLLVYGRQL